MGPPVTSLPMTQSERADAQGARQSPLRQLSISSKVTLTVVPLVAVALLAVVFGLWMMDGVDPVTIAMAVAVGVAAVATLIAIYMVGRSIGRDVDEVTRGVDGIANKDLLELLDALRSPDADLSRLAPPDLDTVRDDEIGSLAKSVIGLHDSLVEMSGRQMESLRKGVSNIFVTLARRNSSLVDRQLAVLDELEAREEDPKVLGGYYQVDHLATRMRRNAESLLVLAGAESPRIWAKPTEMSDVVRAAVGEVDEFQRIEVPALEPARLSGGAVTDISHLLAELLENAIQFSPPSEPVRVTGLFAPDGYQISVSDRGVGMSEARIAEMSRILDQPPSLGLSVEPTLGMYVVSKLAHRHGVRIELIRGVPGITVRITVPRDHLEVEEKTEPRFWETERPTREPVGADLAHFHDAATRQYIVKRAEETAAQPAAAAGDPVIDLTNPQMASLQSADHDLPMRNPGQTLAEDDDSPSTAPAEEAISLQSALSAFDRGRRAAEEGGDPEDQR